MTSFTRHIPHASIGPNTSSTALTSRTKQFKRKFHIADMTTPTTCMSRLPPIHTTLTDKTSRALLPVCAYPLPPYKAQHSSAIIFPICHRLILHLRHIRRVRIFCPSSQPNFSPWQYRCNSSRKYDPTSIALGRLSIPTTSKPVTLPKFYSTSEASCKAVQRRALMY